MASPRRLVRLVLTRPDRLRDKETDLLEILITACPEILLASAGVSRRGSADA
ncbi:hypothetical protein ACFWIQ_33725 [Kitasatospora sp. NPDC127059]|uniref:hypothetical protein n=1 Tax=unclassified Kitasatospora TaxID=2633591 RepID=UPI0036546405